MPIAPPVPGHALHPQPAAAAPIQRQNRRQTDKTGSRLSISAHPNRTISRKTLEVVPREPAKNTGLNMETPL